MGKFFSRFYQRAPWSQLHFASWAPFQIKLNLGVSWSAFRRSDYHLVIMFRKRKPKIFVHALRDTLSVAAGVQTDLESTSLPHVLHLTWIQHQAQSLALSSSWLLCLVRLLLWLTVLVWVQAVPPVAKVHLNIPLLHFLVLIMSA